MPSIVTVSALVVDQESVADCPRSMEVGLTDSVAVGAGAAVVIGAGGGAGGGGAGFFLHPAMENTPNKPKTIPTCRIFRLRMMFQSSFEKRVYRSASFLARAPERCFIFTGRRQCSHL